LGLAHGLQAPSSREHWKLPGSFELNSKEAAVESTEPEGPEVMVV
jgi:hypothetical protein